MSYKVDCVVFIAGLASVAHADLFRMTMSGALDEVVDNRTSEIDPLAGTAFDTDVFTASVGDTWSYEVVFDTDVMPDDYNADQYSIYSAHFASSITIAGQELTMPASFLYYYLDDNGPTDRQIMEIWGYTDLNGNAGVYSSFAEYDMLSMLINGGNVVDNEAMFDGLDEWYFGVYSSEPGLVEWRAGDGPYTVTVEQIPAPSSLAVICLGSLVGSHRRR